MHERDLIGIGNAENLHALHGSDRNSLDMPEVHEISGPIRYLVTFVHRVQESAR